MAGHSASRPCPLCLPCKWMRDFKAFPAYWVARDVNRLKRPLLSHHQPCWRWSGALAPKPQPQLLEAFIVLVCYLPISCPRLCKLPAWRSRPTRPGSVGTWVFSLEPCIQPKTPPGQPPLRVWLVTPKVPDRPLSLRPPAAGDGHARPELEEF